MGSAPHTSHARARPDPSPGGDACRPGEVRGPVAILGWGVPIGLIGLGVFVHEWTASLWAPAFLVMGLTCVANARRCGRIHCYATGPLFLAAAPVLGLVAAGALPEGWVDAIGAGVLVGVALAYGAERLLGRRYRLPS